MARFTYTAVDSTGQRVEAEIVSATIDEARAALTERGLTEIELAFAASETARAPRRLTSKETEDVVSSLANVTNADLPLGPGLRAAAAEVPNRRVAQALQAIATMADQGQDLQTIVGDHSSFLPMHVRGLVAAAARTRRLGTALDDLVEHHRAIRDIWRQVLGSIAYPTLVVFATLAILGFLPIFIVPVFKKMFEEFELDLPQATLFLIEMSDAFAWVVAGPGKWILFGCLFLLSLIVVTASLGLGTAWTQRFAATIPLVGPMWQWSGAAAFSRLLAMLLEQDIPLDKAIAMAADGVSDPDVRETAKLLAQDVENGRALSDAIWQDGRLPTSMAPFVKWGEKTGDLADGLRTMSDILLLRVSMRAALMRVVSPPVVFLFVGLVVGFVVISLFMPMVSLIQGLS